MPTIEIDFEVFKALTVRRETESVSYNDVIRLLLEMPSEARQASRDSAVWTYKGIRFPVGTEFRARYKGKVHFGAVDKDGLVIEGKRAANPSEGARLLTQNNVNGWAFWECRFPGETRWKLLKSLQDGH
jgi:hypothetical protein